MTLLDIDKQVLYEINNFKRDSMPFKELELRFGNDKKINNEIKKAVKRLHSDKYIKGSSPNSDGSFSRVEILPKGKMVFERGYVQPISIGDIKDSNIAINSSDFIQETNLQDSDMKEKIKELEEAIKEKDKSKIVKIFTYIMDKAADVGIAIIINGLK